MIKTEIFDSKRGISADVVKGNKSVGLGDGVMAYTQPFEDISNLPLLARHSETGSIEMAVSAGSNGTADNIHDGTDSAYWTGTNLVQTRFDFASTDQATNGTKSIDATPTRNNDAALFTRDSAITHASYDALTGQIFIENWNTGGSLKEVQIRFRLSGSDIGATVALSSYIDIGQIGSWQAFSIPFVNFALTGTTLDEMVVVTRDEGGGGPPSYYLDELQLSQPGGAGGSQTFIIEPPQGKCVRVYGFTYTIIDNITGILANGTGPALSYDKFGGLTQLNIGLNNRRIIAEEVTFSAISRNNAGLLQGADAKITAFISDGTNTMYKISTTFSGPVQLNGLTNDRFEFVVNDDLTGLISFNIRAQSVLVEPTQIP